MTQLRAGVAVDAPASRPLAEAHSSPSHVSRATPRQGVVTVAFRTKIELYEAWMPFLRGGGLFIATHRACELEEDVFLLVSLMQDPAKIPVKGKVAWINPPNAAGGRPQGIGVSLEGDPAAEDMRRLIEAVLANALGSARPTHTL